MSITDLLTPYAPTVELILKFLALIGGLFGGLPKIWNWLNSPNVKVIDHTIDRKEAEISGGTANMAKSTISWRLLNKRRIFFFGQHLMGVTTSWNLAKGKPGDWAYTGIVGPHELIPIDQGWIQKDSVGQYLEDGTYYLSLVIQAKGRILIPPIKEIVLK